VIFLDWKARTKASTQAFRLFSAEEASKRLRAAGFEKLSERQPWGGLQAGGKYYFTRNASTIVAFAVGAKYTAGNGFHMIGAHTDRYSDLARHDSEQMLPTSNVPAA
jgi:aspartyl aminopeptidase